MPIRYTLFSVKDASCNPLSGTPSEITPWTRSGTTRFSPVTQTSVAGVYAFTAIDSATETLNVYANVADPSRSTPVTVSAAPVAVSPTTLSSVYATGATLSYGGQSSVQANPLTVGYDSTSQSVYFNLGLTWPVSATANPVHNPVEIELVTPGATPAWQSVTPGTNGTVSNFVYVSEPQLTGSASLFVYDGQASTTAQYGAVINGSGSQIVW